MFAPPIRIYIVDEHERVRRALADRLGRTGAVRVVGATRDPREALAGAQAGQADVYLVEVKRSDGLGLELVRQLTQLPEAPRVLVLTTYATEWEEAAARRAGAGAYLMKDLDPDQLLAWIRQPGS